MASESELEDVEGSSLTRSMAPKLDAAVEEIVRTEGDYVLALRTLVTGYMPKMNEFLEGEERATIFGNAPTILALAPGSAGTASRKRRTPSLVPTASSSRCCSISSSRS